MKDKVILVTGSNEGIGFAIARQCYERGAKIVLHGLDQAALKASASKIGADVQYIVADLNDVAAPRAIVDFTLSQFDRIDGLVNNAGMLDRCTLETASAEQERQVNVGIARQPAATAASENVPEPNAALSPVTTA